MTTLKLTKDIYNQTNNEIIKSIDDEINELKSLRNTKNTNIDFSTHNILSSRDEMDIQNQIVDSMIKNQL